MHGYTWLQVLLVYIAHNLLQKLEVVASTFSNQVPPRHGLVHCLPSSYLHSDYHSQQSWCIRIQWCMIFQPWQCTN
jgi:hypothetical protein